MNRWLILTLGLALAAGAAWVMLSADPARRRPPLDDIDDASRERLERVLRDAERQ